MVVETSVPLENCDLANEKVTVHLSQGQLMEMDERNQLSRVERILKRKKLVIDETDYPCFGDTLGLLIIDKENNLRGSYLLEHSDISRLFVELDIIILQESYGKGVSR